MVAAWWLQGPTTPIQEAPPRVCPRVCQVQKRALCKLSMGCCSLLPHTCAQCLLVPLPPAPARHSLQLAPCTTGPGRLKEAGDQHTGTPLITKVRGDQNPTAPPLLQAQHLHWKRAKADHAQMRLGGPAPAAASCSGPSCCSARAWRYPLLPPHSPEPCQQVCLSCSRCTQLGLGTSGWAWMLRFAPQGPRPAAFAFVRASRKPNRAQQQVQSRIIDWGSPARPTCLGVVARKG